MSNVRIELNFRGVGDLLRSDEVAQDLRRRAERVAAAAGEGMEVDESRGSGGRRRASVRTATTEARLAEAKERRLTRAVDAAR